MEEITWDDELCSCTDGCDGDGYCCGYCEPGLCTEAPGETGPTLVCDACEAEFDSSEAEHERMRIPGQLAHCDRCTDPAYLDYESEVGSYGFIHCEDPEYAEWLAANFPWVALADVYRWAGVTGPRPDDEDSAPYCVEPQMGPSRRRAHGSRLAVRRARGASPSGRPRRLRIIR